MNNLYVRLAAQNIKKHRRSYVPFMLAGVFVAAVSYILNSLSNNTELGPTSQMMFTLGSTVVMLFAVIFLFYTNSFLMKQRKKELGLYNVLGMNKGHIARVIGLETLFTAFIVILLGYWIIDYIKTVFKVEDQQKALVSYILITISGPIGGLFTSVIVSITIGNYNHRHAGTIMFLMYFL